MRHGVDVEGLRDLAGRRVDDRHAVVVGVGNKQRGAVEAECRRLEPDTDRGRLPGRAQVDDGDRAGDRAARSWIGDDRRAVGEVREVARRRGPAAFVGDEGPGPDDYDLTRCIAHGDLLAQAWGWRRSGCRSRRACCSRSAPRRACCHRRRVPCRPAAGRHRGPRGLADQRVAPGGHGPVGADAKRAGPPTAGPRATYHRASRTVRRDQRCRRRGLVAAVPVPICWTTLPVLTLMIVTKPVKYSQLSAAR